MFDPQSPLLTYVIQRLKSETGLTQSHLALQGAIDRRCQLQGELSKSAYRLQLQQCPDEWQSLLDLVVIPETMFFRDRVPFEALGDWVRQEWSLHHKTQKPILRGLSLPCSTGEEAYSIAMTLVNAGLSPTQFELDAIDISHRCIAIAQRGQYANIHGRSVQPLFKQDRIQAESINPVERQFEIVPWLRNRIHFSVQSAFQTLEAASMESYDIIFCRNLMIYFDAATRLHLLTGLDRCLKPNGILVVGHSELGLVDRDRWSPLPLVHACSFQKKTSPKNASANHPKSSTSKSSRMGGLGRGRDSDNKAEGVLLQVQALADRGDLEQALKDCQTYLTAHPLCEQGQALIAQIYLAIGQPQQAEAALHRVLYLNPHHQDALFQLSLLRSVTGDSVGSDRLLQRLQRLQA